MPPFFKGGFCAAFFAAAFLGAGLVFFLQA